MAEIGQRELRAHVWGRVAGDHYVEPEWVSGRLFEAEYFHGQIWDPACGLGRIVESAAFRGYDAIGTDIQHRPSVDFLSLQQTADNIVTNPPFNLAERFFLHAIRHSRGKVAMVFPTARLNAAHWIENAEPARIWMLTPRPSMPPASVILAGGKPGGGKMDYCWIVWDILHRGRTEIRWLHRDHKS